MKKKLCLAFGLAAVLGIVGYRWFENFVMVYHEYALKAAITSIEEDTVILNDLIPFEWDTLYHFPPYMTTKEMVEIIGFDSSYLHETYHEGQCNFVFVKGDQVMASVSGFSSELGYDLCFSDPVEFADKRVFLVERKENFVRLTAI